MAELPLKQDFFDPSKEFIKVKNAYERLMGSKVSKHNPFYSYPKTTWGQVTTFWLAWERYIDPKECYERLPPGYYTGRECHPTRDASFNRAEAAFNAVSPFSKSGGVSDLAAKIESNAVYPWNDDFWYYGKQFAIELGASVNLPTKMDYAAEAISEAISEAPGVVKNAISKLDPRNLFPKMPLSFGDMMVWGFVGVLAYGAYWVYKRDQ